MLFSDRSNLAYSLVTQFTALALLLAGAGCSRDTASSEADSKAEASDVAKDTTTANSSLPKDQTGMTRFQTLADSLEELGVKVTWQHPKTGPKDPKFILGNPHVLANNSIQGTAHKDAMFQTFQVLSKLYDSGLRSFRCEGAPSNRTMSPVIAGFRIKSDTELEVVFNQDEEVHNDPESLLAISGMLQEKSIFHSYLDQVAGKIPTPVLSAFVLSRPGITIHGAENPHLDSELDRLDQTLAAVEPFYVQFKTAFENLPENDKSIYFRHVPDQHRVACKVDNMIFDAQSLLNVINTKLNPLELPINREREEYAASVDAELVVFGASHCPYFKTTETDQSLGIIELPSIAAIDSEGDATFQYLPNVRDHVITSLEKHGVEVPSWPPN